MTGIERKDKDWEEDKIKRAMREEITKCVRDKLCTTLQHRSEAIRKDHKFLTREYLNSVRYRYKDDTSFLKEGHITEMRRLREGMRRRNRRRKRRRRRQI